MLDTESKRRKEQQKQKVKKPGIEDGGAYRLTGSVIPSLKVAVFSLKTLQRMDR